MRGQIEKQGSSSKLREGFTLVELLAVLGIIAVLIAILLPALSRAREHARRLVCTSNQRQLVMAWGLYSNEFKGFIPLGYPDGGTTSATPNNKIDPLFIPWVIGDRRESGAKPYVVWGANSGRDWLIRAGCLFRYLHDERMFRCPEHDPNYGINEINISYAFNNYLNGAGAPVPKILKRAQIRKPAEVFVTIDQVDMYMWPKPEDERSGIVYCDWAGWTIAPPAPRHAWGSCLTFADGHCEYWRWKRGDVWGTFAKHNSAQNTAANADEDMSRLRAVRGY